VSIIRFWDERSSLASVCAVVDDSVRNNKEVARCKLDEGDKNGGCCSVAYGLLDGHGNHDKWRSVVARVNNAITGRLMVRIRGGRRPMLCVWAMVEAQCILACCCGSSVVGV
jgi:hypothetical protein